MVPQRYPRLSVAGSNNWWRLGHHCILTTATPLKKRANYDRQGVWVSEHGGMTMITADLPDLEGRRW